MSEVRLLTIRQPWADAIVSGHKTIEVRSWSTPYRGWILIRAGLNWEKAQQDKFQLAKKTYGLSTPTPTHFGGIVGIAFLCDIRPMRPSDAPLAYSEAGDDSLMAWELSQFRSLRFRPQPKGVLGLVRAPDQLVHEIELELGFSLDKGLSLL